MKQITYFLLSTVALLLQDCNGSFVGKKQKRRQIVEEILAEVERNEDLSRKKRDHLEFTQQAFSSEVGCSSGGHQPNHRFGGKDYLVSWRLGCSSFAQSEADSFCQRSGMRPISIDSSAKEREFLSLVGRENQKYFWTGGKLSGRARRGDTIQWPSGRTFNNVNWSGTGG